MSGWSKASSNQCLDRDTMHVGQSEIAPVMVVGQPLVVYTKLMQNRGVNVMHRGTIHGGMISDLIRFPVGHSRLDSSAGHEGGIAIGMVISSVSSCMRSATKFPSPHDQRFLQHTPFLQISDETGYWFIGVIAMLVMVFTDVAMRIPVCIIVIASAVYLDKAHTTFNKTPSK